MTSEQLPPYIEYGALATAPGPLLCERARLYCFFLKADHARVQELCDRVLSEPAGGAVRYRVSRVAPVVLSLGTIGGLRSLHPGHAGRGSAFEPEAAIWVPVIAQRLVDGEYVDRRLAIFMPYIWVDDPIAFAAGREVYGFAKTQGWIGELGDPRLSAGAGALPDPPAELALDVYGTTEYHEGAELGRTRLITIRRAEARRSIDPIAPGASGDTLSGLVDHFHAGLRPEAADAASAPPAAPALERDEPDEPDEPVRRSIRSRIEGLRATTASVTGFLTEQTIHHVFLKQFRDAAHGDRAVLQQVVEARSSVVPGTLAWRRLRGSYEIGIESLVTQPLSAELGIELQSTVRHAFVAEFGFAMDPGEVVWSST